MDNLLLLITQLPKDLQDHIWSYNVEHRKHMKSICEELEKCESEKIRCHNCERKIKTKFAIFCSYNYNCYSGQYCSVKCADKDEEYLRYFWRRSIHFAPKRYDKIGSPCTKDEHTIEYQRIPDIWDDETDGDSDIDGDNDRL